MQCTVQGPLNLQVLQSFVINTRVKRGKKGKEHRGEWGTTVKESITIEEDLGATQEIKAEKSKKKEERKQTEKKEQQSSQQTNEPQRQSSQKTTPAREKRGRGAPSSKEMKTPNKRHVKEGSEQTPEKKKGTGGLGEN